MKTAKKQEYKYTLKTAVYTSPDSIGLCDNKILFYLFPPQDSIAIKYMRTKLKFQFDAGVTAADRIISGIGISSKFDSDSTAIGYFKSIDLNIAADVNRNVVLDMNLTSLLNEDNVRYNADLFSQAIDDGYTYIWVKLGRDNNLANVSTVGSILLWKADGLFTTIGVK